MQRILQIPIHRRTRAVSEQESASLGGEESIVVHFLQSREWHAIGFCTTLLVFVMSSFASEPVIDLSGLAVDGLELHVTVTD